MSATGADFVGKLLPGPRSAGMLQRSLDQRTVGFKIGGACQSSYNLIHIGFMKPVRDTPLSFRISRELRAKVEAAAEADSRSVSSFVIMALIEKLSAERRSAPKKR
jgi:hypothetical protein